MCKYNCNVSISFKKFNCFIELNSCFGIAKKRAYNDRYHKFQIIFYKRKDFLYFIFIIDSWNIDKLDQAANDTKLLPCDALINKNVNLFDFCIFRAWVTFVLISLVVFNFFSKLLYWIESFHFFLVLKMDLCKYNRLL